MYIIPDTFNFILILFHALLNSTSFIFKLSSSRIRVTPIIWPEGRWHSIIFAYRSIIIIYLFFLCWYTHIELLNYLRGIVVLLTIVSADYVTNYYKINLKILEENDSTMRKMPSPSYIPLKIMNILNIFYSVSQIFATMNCIFAKNIDKIFIILFPIQIAMFLMTLAKKNIITSGGWHLWYTIALLTNYFITAYSNILRFDIFENRFFYTLAFIFIFLRLKYNFNKYYLWCMIILIHWLCMFYLDKFKISYYSYYP